MTPFELTLITREPVLAAAAAGAGVQRIGVDIERLGKAARQPGPNARISDHELTHLAVLKPTVGGAVLFARLNPFHPGSPAEIDEAVANGARRLMLPYFSTAGEVAGFVRAVDGRAEVSLLLETAAAVVRLHDVLAVGGFDEVMVGLNDLSLSLGVENPFAVAASDLLALVSDQVRGAGLRFGFGGVAHPEDRGLPVAPDAVLALHALLGSTGGWLSRSFLSRRDPTELPRAVAELRARLDVWRGQPQAALEAQRSALREALAA